MWGNCVDSIDAATFRQAMARFCTGVTIVTTCTGAEAAAHGMTATAFSSLSLSPPLILVCIDVRTRMHDLLAEATAFGVSILSENQHNISARFSGAPETGKVPFAWRMGVPLVEHAIVQIVADLSSSHREGDHTIFVGRVTGCWMEAGHPLVYYAGDYRKIA